MAVCSSLMRTGAGTGSQQKPAWANGPRDPLWADQGWDLSRLRLV